MTTTRTDPFRELDRLARTVFGPSFGPTAASGRAPRLPLDAYRDGDSFVAQLDLPGVDPDSIDITVDKNVLSIRAERKSPARDENDALVSERFHGVFARRLFLGDSLDLDALTADYDQGVLTIRIPVTEQAKPRKVTVTSGAENKQLAA